MTKNVLKIAFVYDDSLDGSEGVAQQVKLIGGWMSMRGHKVSYFVGQTKATSWQGDKIYSLSVNHQVSFNGNRVFIPLLAKAKDINRALTAESPDILHIMMPHSPLMAQRVLNLSGLPAVGTFHIFPANNLANVGAKILRLAYIGGLKKICYVVSVSSAAQAFAKSAFGLKTDIIPNAIDVKSMANNTPTDPDTIVFLGRLVERKGCAQLIRAFALVHHAVPTARLVIGGEGRLKDELQGLARRYKVADAIEFKGFVKEEDKAAFLGQAKIACFPSLYGESFGLVLVEAMAAGAEVVIGGDNPGYRSVLAPKPELLVDPNNTEAFAQTLIGLLNDPTRCKAIKKWQTGYVKQFDIDNVGAAYEKLYERAIAKYKLSRHN